MSGASGVDRVDVAAGQAVGERADQLGAGAERRLPRRFRGQLLDRGPTVTMRRPPAALLRREAVAERGQAAEPCARDRPAPRACRCVTSRGDRRRALPGAEDAAAIEIDRAQLGVCAAEIDQQARPSCRAASACDSRRSRAAKSCARMTITSSVRVPGRKGAVEAHGENALLHLLATSACRPPGCRRHRSGCRSSPASTQRSRKPRQSSSPWPYSDETRIASALVSIGRLDEVLRRRQRAERDDFVAGLFERHARMRLPTMCVSEPMTPVTSVFTLAG